MEYNVMKSTAVLSTSVSRADTSAKCEPADKGETQEVDTNINTITQIQILTEEINTNINKRVKYKYEQKRQIQI